MRIVEPRVVIVGGGFGGLYAASYLGRSELAEEGARIVLVDAKNYFSFTPLLAEVVAGKFGRQHVTTPYRILGKRYGFDFVQDEARGLDLDRGVVRTRFAEIPFDYLVVAVGAEPRYFGNDALRAGSLPFVGVDHALAIRDAVVGAYERRARDGAAHGTAPTFVVAGGGPAGVEAASEIHVLANDSLRPYYPHAPSARVILAEGSDRILQGWDEELACAGQERLRERGLDVRLGTRIEDVENGTVELRSEEEVARVPADALVWTAGTAPSRWAADQPLPTEKGAIRIDATLRVTGRKRIFAVGDVTTLVDERTGRPYPRVAPIAISQGVHAAHNIENHAFGRDLETYRATHAGNILSLGGGEALVDLLGIRITGPLAWWIYRTTYLLKLVGTKNKLRVAFTLALDRFFEPDISAETRAVMTSDR